MDDFSPVYWIVYIFMGFFVVFLAWEIIKMIIAIITGKYTKGPGKKKGVTKK